ncbi:MAG TPA: FG-GAP repeat protein [Herpetosiphonaceae bacterium]|nr:FG-GAP repeat protein [Herpetosiphonaceae bacterium]
MGWNRIRWRVSLLIAVVLGALLRPGAPLAAPSPTAIWTERAYHYQSMPLRFGLALALDGTTLVSGGGGYPSHSEYGVVHVFERDQGGPNSWGWLQRLDPPEDSTDSRVSNFGRAVALGGGTLVVGDPGRDVIHFYARDPATRRWSLQSSLESPVSPTYGAYGFGHPLVIQGDILAVGGTGKVYVYRRSAAEPTGWRVSGTLEYDPLQPRNAQFGASIAIRPDPSGEGNDRILVGAPCMAYRTITCAGSAQLFTANQGRPEWLHLATLTPANGASGDQFGAAVAFADQRLIVGAPGTDITGQARPYADVGAVYIFGPVTGGWAQLQRLTSPTLAWEAAFGRSLAVEGQLLVVGAPRESYVNEQGFAVQGAVYGFDRNRGGPDAWGLLKRQLGSRFEDRDTYGSALAIQNGTLAVGTGNADRPSFGLTYVYSIVWAEPPPPLPTLTPRLPQLP